VARSHGIDDRSPQHRRPAPVRYRAFAWTGAALFAASLLYFLFSYAVTFRETVPGPLDPIALATNIGLFTVFALHHSVFARPPVRRRVERALPPVLERSFYVWVASMMLIGVCALWQPLAGIAWQLPAALGWLPPVVQLAGVAITLRSAAIIDIWELAGVRQLEGRPEGRPLHTTRARRGGPSGPPSTASSSGPSGPLSEFRTDGPYGWVRHPIYLGWFLLVFGVGTMTMTRLVLAAVSCAYILIAIPLEEASLRRTAPDRYAEYMRKVRWKLAPYVY
jgi:protein-S-isoprenylcysteine O-methyltransferase Ste14